MGSMTPQPGIVLKEEDLKGIRNEWIGVSCDNKIVARGKTFKAAHKKNTNPSTRFMWIGDPNVVFIGRYDI